MEQFNEFLASPLGVICVIVALGVAGWLFFGVKQWEASWKQYAVDAAGQMRAAGLTHTPKVLEALAVGNLAVAFQEIKHLVTVFSDPKQRAAEFQNVFANMLDAAKKDPAQLKALQQFVADATKGAATTVLAADAGAALALNPLTALAAPPTLAAALLPHLPALAASPVLQQIASSLQAAGLGNLIPAVIAGHSVGTQSAAPSASPDLTTQNSDPTPAAPAPALPAVPAGHSITINGPALPDPSTASAA